MIRVIIWVRVRLGIGLHICMVRVMAVVRVNTTEYRNPDA